MQKEEVPTKELKGALHSSVLLFGNHFSVERCKATMKHLNVDIIFLAEADYPDFLFGVDFGKKAKEASDNISALTGIKEHFPGAVTQAESKI